MHMPGLHTRKLISLGGSKVVALPQDWLRWLESKHGPVKEVIVQTNGVAIIKPKLSGNMRTLGSRP